MAVFYTSDHHFGHANIISYAGRPFTSTERMNEELVRAWNTQIEPDDEVWLLGDVALGKPNESLRYIERLNGRKVLVPGNHDRCWLGHKKGAASRQRYLDAGFAEIVDEPEPIWHEGHKVLVSHFPYRGTGDHRDTTERHREHKPLDEGHWLLHGHVHERWRVKGRQINVGVDAWGGYPQRLERLLHYVTESHPRDREPWKWSFLADTSPDEREMVMTYWRGVEQNVTYVSPEAWDQLQADLQRPPRVIPELVRLFREHPRLQLPSEIGSPTSSASPRSGSAPAEDS